MPLQNFVNQSAPAIGATWLNAIDAFYFTLFNSATTTAAARTAISAAQSGANTDITSLSGPALGTPASGVATNLTGTAAALTAGYALEAGSDGAFSFRNKIIGHFDQNQRGLTSVGDDAYCLDRWYVLTETGNVTVAQIADPESGAPWAVRLTQPDASPKRIGLATIIEAKDIKAYRSAAMNLYLRVKPSFSGNVRYAILEHTGTADVVTSDVVSNWASTNFTASNFFIAGLNVIKTGTLAPGAATYGTLNDYGTFGASLNNAILFVWSESAQAQNATLELNRPQFEPGAIHTPHEWRLNELSLCQRYYYRVPGITNNYLAISGWASSTTAAVLTNQFPVPMRIAPSALEQSGTVTDYRVYAVATPVACSAVPTFGLATTLHASTTATVAAGLTGGQFAPLITAAASGNGYLGWSAEL